MSYSETTRSIKVTVEPVLPRGSVLAGGESLCLGLSRPDRESGRRDGAVAPPPLAHHRRASAASRRCAAPASSASSRCWRRASPSNIPAARRSARRPASWSAATRWKRADGESFAVAIPAFSLDSPHQQRAAQLTAARVCRTGARSWPSPTRARSRAEAAARPSREEAEAAVRTLIELGRRRSPPRGRARHAGARGARLRGIFRRLWRRPGRAPAAAPSRRPTATTRWSC